MDAVVSTNRLSKRYGGRMALEGVSISVRPGDIYGVVGDNGAGKTTLFKLICGLVFPTAGEMNLLGAYAPKDLENRRARVGALIESPGFYPNLSVEKNMECYRIQKGVPGKASVTRSLEFLNLDQVKNTPCKALSMGMKQRLGLAMALLGDPEVLILDEPINGLDPSGIVEMRNLLQKLNQERGITIVLSSHNLAELEQLAGVYAFLNRGRLVEQVSAANLRERCANYVEIAVSDPARYAVLLEKVLNHERYQVMPDGVLRIHHPVHEIEVFSGLASQHNMAIYRLERREISLEQYYLGLNEGGVSRV